MAGVSWPGRTRLSGSGGDFAVFGISRRGGLVCGLGRTPPPCLRLLEPVALAVQLQNMDMMREAIEKRASETLAAEDGGPFLKGKIRRDDGRAAFVTLAEYFEEKLRAGLRERHIAEFVGDEPFDGGDCAWSFRRRRASRAAAQVWTCWAGDRSPRPPSASSAWRRGGARHRIPRGPEKSEASGCPRTDNRDAIRQSGASAPDRRRRPAGAGNTRCPG